MKKIWTIYKETVLACWHYIIFTAVLSLVWLITGFAIVTIFPQTLPIFIKILQDIFHSILGDIGTLTDSQLAQALFVQNTTSSLYNLFLGGILGIVPVVSLAVNFFALGFLSGPFVYPALFPGLGSPLTFVLSIAPHGIFEIPALLLSAAFGLRLGWAWLMPGASGKRWKTFLKTLSDAFVMVPVIVILLAVAAFVEAFVTQSIVS